VEIAARLKLDLLMMRMSKIRQAIAAEGLKGS